MSYRQDVEDSTTRLILRATVLVTGLSVVGALLGLFRDLLLARFFGATGETDAFLVAWTVPETASPLLIEGAMGFLLVPIFVRALNSEHGLVGVVRATLPRLAAVLGLAAAVVAITAPVLVRLLAPGPEKPHLAVQCTRITAVTIFTFGLAGYLGAALRSAHAFGWQGTIYVAYNVGILAAILMLHVPLGVTSAAIGVAVGSVLMIVVQVPSFLRRLHLGVPRTTVPAPRIALAAFIPIASFTLTRQAQVFIERFLGSQLPAGAISHLNYAQKVAQVPMTLAVMVPTVTYPMLARSVANGDQSATRERTESDLRIVNAVVLMSTAYVIAFAHPIIAMLFQHGAFTAADTSATAMIMRVYAFGLLGQAAVGTLGRSYFSGVRPTWYPALVMGVGLALTAVIGALLMWVWGAPGIAAGNAAGITVAAVLMLTGLRGRPEAVAPRAIGKSTATLLAAASVAGLTGFLACQMMHQVPAPLALVAGAFVVTGVFFALGIAMGVREIRQLGGLVGLVRHA